MRDPEHREADDSLQNQPMNPSIDALIAEARELCAFANSARANLSPIARTTPSEEEPMTDL
ncbi:MAG: hypothetical protein AAB489_02020 [Patescibacteria group bacterium]